MCVCVWCVCVVCVRCVCVCGVCEGCVCEGCESSVSECVPLGGLREEFTLCLGSRFAVAACGGGGVWRWRRVAWLRAYGPRVSVVDTDETERVVVVVETRRCCWGLDK